MQSFVFPAAADAADPRLRAFFDYWRSKAPPGGLPGRQHIEPLEIPHLLPGILLYDVVDDGGRQRFRCRLVGTSITEAVGMDHTGRFMDEVILVSTRYEALHAALAGVVRDRQPHFWRTWISDPARDHVSFERLAVPLASDGHKVDIVMGYYVYGARARRHAGLI